MRWTSHLSVIGASLAASVAGCAAPSTPVACSPPPDTSADAGLVAAQQRLVDEVTENDELDISFEGPPIDLTPPCTLDVEWGSGHGGSLVFVRLHVGAATTACERVAWQDYRPKPLTHAAGEASRIEFPTATIRLLLDDVRALSQARVTKRPDPDHAWGSSGDFFVLVRVRGVDRDHDRTWEFAGYSSSSDQVRYAAPEIVVRNARGLLERLAWTPVPTDAFRTTHFSDAFTRNRDFYNEQFHWWVTRRSVDMLGWFGDRSALPTLQWMSDQHPLGRVLEAPDHYLSGPPRDFWEK